MIGRTISHYRIIARVGEGAMGIVYRAEDLTLHRKVALKFLPEAPLDSPGLRSRFLNEARAAAALNHPNICTVYEIDETNGFIAMEFVEGRNLQQVMGGLALPQSQALDIASQIAQGLEAAHEKGIVHRDIKPANILLTAKGEVKIADFGLALLTGDPELTRDGAICGTPAYMAPEQLRGDAVDRRADFWALGMLIQEMLTGRLAGTANAGASPPFDRVLARCLAPDPAGRYQNAAELLNDLRSAAAPRRAIPWAFIAAGAAILLVAISTYFVRLPTSRQVSVAVLPLANLSGDPEQEYFSDGMTDALITDLSSIRALRVISRTSTLQYKKSNKLLPVIARELGVTHIVEGSVVRSGSRVRVTAQLIDAATDQHLWARSFDREAGDILALHSELASAIAGEVRVQLHPEEKTRLASPRPVLPQAYEAYLKGRQASGLGPGNIPNAIEHFRSAIRLDPTYAPAFSALATSLVFTANLGVRPATELMPAARDAAEKALALDPGLGEAHTAIGNICTFFDYNWPCAGREHKRASDLNPGEPEVHHWYSHYLVTQGNLAQALVEIRRARDLDPAAPLFTADIVDLLALMGRNKESLEQAGKLFEFQKKDDNDSHQRIALAYGRQGNFREAIASLKEVAPEARTPRTISLLGYFQGRAGQRADSLRCLEDLRSLTSKRYISPFELATIHIGLGDREKAFEFLDQAYAARNFGLMTFKTDSLFDPIRSDPRFRELLEKIGLPN